MITRKLTSSLKSSARKGIPDIDKLPGSALLTDAQTATLAGITVGALQKWRREGGTRGPVTTWLEGRPRTRVADFHAWVAGRRGSGSSARASTSTSVFA